MNLRTSVIACASALAMVACVSSPAQAATKTFVYRGAGCDGKKAMAAFETMLGKKADGAVDFVNYTADWAGAVSASNWGSWCWANSGYQLAWSVPLAVSKGTASSLSDVASGKANTYFTQIAQALVKDGHQDAYIRLGWEFNGGWYPWGGHNPTQIAQAYRQAHDAMAAVPGAKFRFVWNPALYMQGFWPDQAYPGDQYVDIIATDAYNMSWSAGYKDPAVMRNDVMNASWGVAELVKFAQKHKKPYAFPEWGTGYRPDGHSDGDDPAYIAMMAPIVNASEFSGYWDFHASDFDGAISDGSKPLTRTAFVAAFGAPAKNAPTPPPSPNSTPNPPAPTPPPAPAPLTVTVDHGGSVVIDKQPDGSAYLRLTFPAQKTATTFVITLSASRKIGWSPTSVWYTNKVFTWNVPANNKSTASVWVSAN